MPIIPAIEIKNLYFTYKQTEVLSNINLEIKSGQYVGLLGPNGGGKTTLIKILLGILKPDSGFVKIYASSLASERKRLGYVPQRFDNLNQFPASVNEVVASGFLGRNSYLKSNLDRVFKSLEIEKLQDKMISQLSGGEKQKVFIARSLINDPDILILDEPTVAIDRGSEEKFYELLRRLNKEEGKTIIMISHDIGTVTKEADRIIFLNQQISCYHTVAEFLKPENLEGLYGQSSQILNHHH